ncbi:hypothetical protein O6027_19835 [Sphingomonas aerolata]|uniref:hypothetical protein n=1 Tax=Sphingomonas aerolata TaxID=185951 RepID=UPI00334D730C
MTTVLQYLIDRGPSRSSLIVEDLVAAGASPEAARQRVSRAGKPIRRFPVPLLPKRESFLYLEKDRNSDRFWENFMRDLRATNSVYAAAMDGMVARHGIIPADQFKVVSGATVYPVSGQLSSEMVASRLIAASFMKEVKDSAGVLYYELPPSLASGNPAGMRARDLTERILLDAMREWCRKIGLASYNAVRIRGDADLKAIGPYAFDLAGPSYLLPMLGGASKPGWFVADVFAEGRLGVHEIQFFIRKARILHSTLKDVGIMPIIVAEEFAGEAIKAGHAAGVMLATPKDLFGHRVGAALTSLCEVLKNAAAYAASSPKRLTMLLENLMEIEGRNGNLRGVLFELVAGHLARRDAVSIDMNVRARDPKTGKTADIDIQKITAANSSVTAIECKGKEPGGSLSLDEVKVWLGKIATIRAFYQAHYTLCEAKQSFEIWTSGTIDPDALELLKEEQVKRTKAPIAWRDGTAVYELALEGKEKGIADALKQHFFHHPLTEVATALSTMEGFKLFTSAMATPGTGLSLVSEIGAEKSGMPKHAQITPALLPLPKPSNTIDDELSAAE